MGHGRPRIVALTSGSEPVTVKVAADVAYRDHLAVLPAGVHVEWFESLPQAMAATSGAEALALGPDRGWSAAELLDTAPRLRWVHTRAAGVDRGQLQPLRRFREAGITLTNGSGISSAPIAEYVVMAVLAIAKGLPGLLATQRQMVWAKPARTRDVQDSTVLLLGFGEVGHAVWERLRPFGVAATAVRRHPAAEPGIEVVGPEAWRSRIGEFDWVIVTAPLSSQTRSMIGAAELAGMKSDAWLLNVSRGGIVDQPALTAALRAGAIGGACLDVTDPEPLPADSELWAMPNVIVTPHSSWVSPRFAERAAELLADNLCRWCAGQSLRNLVDLEAGY
jgi:phosphoglycerate dehydrogenase-like enzyme